MKRLTTLNAAALACALLCIAASAQRRATTTKTPTKTATSKSATARRTTTTTHKTTTARTTTTRATTHTAANNSTPHTPATDARMTGLYRLDAEASADVLEIARRAAASLPPAEQQQVFDDLAARLNSPPQIAIQRRGRSFDIASTRAERITFDADGQTYIERAADGHTVRTRAVVYGDSLMVSSRGSSADEFSVNFDALGAGRTLRVTRRIYEPRLTQPVVVQSYYQRVSQVARFNIYGEPVPAAVAESARNRPATRRTTATDAPTQADRDRAARDDRAPYSDRASRSGRDSRDERDSQSDQPRRPPPVIRQPEPPRPSDTGFYIGEHARFVGTLNVDLDTERTREGDPFTITVREPQAFAGATVEGRIARVERGGPFSGRAGITLEFDRIVLRDGRSANFSAYVEDVRPANGDDAVRVDEEAGGGVEAGAGGGNRTAERTAIGAAIGALIGAVADGGKGAAIGAAVGAGAGLGSVYVQGRDNLPLPRGTEVAVRTTRR
jgi:hypothetical protein